ncbi:alanine racemase [candidate division KSB1 bacterium]
MMEIWDLDTPSLVVDLDILENNINRMASYCKIHNLALRPHIKTHKVPEIAKMQIEAGAAGITCAKVTEAAVMAEAGIDDILIAYPIIGEEKVKNLMLLAEKAKISVALDSVTCAEAISKEAHNKGKTIGILTEVDVGMNRSGWQIGDELVEDAKRISGMKGLDFKGIMMFWGFIKTNIYAEKKKELEKIQEYIQKAYDLFDKAGIPIEIMSGVSTPTAFLSHTLKGLTEIRPGTYVYNDLTIAGCGSAGLEDCALKVLTSAVSTTIPGQIMIDAGFKTMSCALLTSGDKAGYGRVFGDDQLYVNRMNEELGVIDISKSDSKFSVGDKLLIIPNHCCTTNNMHNEVYGIRNNKVELVWNIAARGKVR